ncbi:class I SAM-dependent methyltransferase [Ovoidimarina sediminis]|uniref:class I SAM-dependent methyltransferase n=1 Tax=Ovoidimarina sediminis TaxID=3079856 RepID=UPI00290C2332|nr:class I SAM-dependent methyltransferase [Rhodophyticola sp. MJ-SS7]MDU8945120.1 class I SAM-dependent methyltransferase [Rhodophyticola sp. MJ-SS7]
MTDPNPTIAAHYGHAGLYDRILAALGAAGHDAGALTPDHLKPVDEFHIGGVAATEALLGPLRIGAGTRVLDLGSGIGGPARFIATRYGAEVTGIDLTPEFVAVAKRLSDLVGVTADFVEGSVLDLPFGDNSFDLLTLLHVGMNLPDKPRLFAEAARVMAPGARFAVYDVMRFGDHPEFPLPWASAPEGSFLDAPEAYLAAAEAAGLGLQHRADRGEVARAFFADLQAKVAAEGAPPIGLPILMGEDAAAKIGNMVRAVNAGHIQPVEMVFAAEPTA